MTSSQTFTLRFINVFCSAEGRTFSDLEAALDYGRSVGFEFQVYQADGQIAAVWTIFGGTTVYSRDAS